jgi:hypothetical protein
MRSPAVARRGIAVHTLVLVIMMAMFAIVAVFLFYKWATPSAIEATAVSCEFKKLAYCADWKTNAYGATKPWSWDDKPPAGCESFGVAQPLTRDDCPI